MLEAAKFFRGEEYSTLCVCVCVCVCVVCMCVLNSLVSFLVEILGFSI